MRIRVRYGQVLLLPVGVLIHRDDRVLYANPCVGRYTGRDPDRLEGRPVTELVHVEHAPPPTEFQAVASVRSPEVHLRHADGHDVVCDATTLLVELDDGPATMLAVRDVTRLAAGCHRGASSS